MYDMTSLITRYFNIKLANGVVLDIEPPKLKVLKRITSLSKSISSNELTDTDISNLSEAISICISKNKQGYNMSTEAVDNMFGIDEMYDFLTQYFNWVSEIQNSKN